MYGAFLIQGPKNVRVGHDWEQSQWTQVIFSAHGAVVSRLVILLLFIYMISTVMEFLTKIMLVRFLTISSTQSEPAYCGVTTLVIVLNALSVDPRRVWKGPWRWYEESMLNCCMDMEEIKNTGITLGVFVCLAKCQGLAVDATLASDSSRDEFRQAVRLACVKNMDDEAGEMQGKEISSRHTFLVVSYSRAALKQTGSGHFPLWLPMMRHRIPS
jgi:hypothetical protein